jgi:hypothetical protein
LDTEFLEELHEIVVKTAATSTVIAKRYKTEAAVVLS